MYFKPQNKFLFQNHCACVRDLGNKELHCSFLHRDVHFPSVNKAAGPPSRRNSCMKLVKNEILAMEGFCFVTYQYASNRMNATYLWFMPERGDLPEEIHRRGLMQRKPARGKMNFWFSLCIEFVTTLCLCLFYVRRLGCGLFFWWFLFLSCSSHAGTLKALALMLPHGWRFKGTLSVCDACWIGWCWEHLLTFAYVRHSCSRLL